MSTRLRTLRTIGSYAEDALCEISDQTADGREARCWLERISKAANNELSKAPIASMMNKPISKMRGYRKSPL